MLPHLYGDGCGVPGYSWFLHFDMPVAADLVVTPTRVIDLEIPQISGF